LTATLTPSSGALRLSVTFPVTLIGAIIKTLLIEVTLAAASSDADTKILKKLSIIKHLKMDVLTFSLVCFIDINL
jgi:hypothetical protein